MTAALLDVRPGDRVVAVNGRPLPWVLVVEEVLDGGRSARVTPPHPTPVEWRLYADRDLDVQTATEPAPTAPEPQPAPEPLAAASKPRRPHRVPSKTVEGIRLLSGGGGHWASEDGRYGVQQEWGLTFCEDQHPARLNADSRREVLANPRAYSTAKVEAARRGARGYLCPGGQEHAYPVWTAWAPGARGADLSAADSMSEALDVLAAAIRAERA